MTQLDTIFYQIKFTVWEIGYIFLSIEQKGPIEAPKTLQAIVNATSYSTLESNTALLITPDTYDIEQGDI